ncbi:MAG: hypothetical protein ABFD90_17395 [Phycisphaerales bacterium]
MAHRRRTGIRPSGRIMAVLADSRKTVLACSLVAVMAIMWIRVLIGHKPASAGAAPKQAATTQPNEPAARVRMVEVPRTPGRNDSIDRDCFNMQGRTQFQRSVAVQNTGTDTEVPVVSPNHDEEVKQVAQTLKLEAVLRNGTPLAFLNDRLVQEGDTFTVERGTSVLEFEVLRIYEDAVLVKCKDIQLTLQLAQFVDVRK